MAIRDAIINRVTVGGSGQTVTAQNFQALLGGGLSVKAGVNGRAGEATLVSGTVTVPIAGITATTIAIYNRKIIGGTAGNLAYSISAGTSITFTSTQALETSTLAYLLIETA